MYHKHATQNKEKFDKKDRISAVCRSFIQLQLLKPRPPSIIIVDLIEIRTQEQTLRLIQQINNSDKGSGNTLLLSSQATERNRIINATITEK